MNDSQELALIRTELRAAIERDLRNRSPRVPLTHRRSVRLGIPTLAAVAVATVAIVLGLSVSAASPPSASAAARRALAATTGAPSGTVTTTVLHAGITQTVDDARWNGNDIAYSPHDGSIQQLFLVGGGMYVQTLDGTWLHYADATNVPPKPLGSLAQLARADIAATTVQQILGLATGVQKTTRSDGTTAYTGTIPASSLNPALLPGNDAITNMILGAQKRTDGMVGAGRANGQNPGVPCCQSDLQLQMSVGTSGLVKQLSISFQQQNASSPALEGTYTWSVTYNRLGSTPPVTAPASSSDVPPATLPPGTLPPNTPGTRGSRLPSR
jgi:hypothetical protein